MDYLASPTTIPDETKRIAQQSFPKGNVYMTMRDEIGVIYHDSQFGHLFSYAGRPAESPGNLALVMVMQYMEGLTDAQAAEQVRARIDWKYALGLEPTDAGFHHDVLRKFRDRLLAGNEADGLLNHMLAHFAQKGWVKAGGQQRTDSTHILAAVRNLNRLELVGETLRTVLEQLATIVPEWLMHQITGDWQERYGKRFDAYRLPKKANKQRTLAEQIGADGVYLLQRIYDAQSPHRLETLPAIEILRSVWIQQFEYEEGQVRWRKQKGLPPAALLIESPYDSEARYSYKRDTEWVGYKAHFTETCDNVESPNVITNVATTDSPDQDRQVVDDVHQALSDKELLPDDHLVDQAYVDAGNLATSRFEHEVDLIGPAPPDTSWQAKAGQGFSLNCFSINWETQQVTCPMGQVSCGWYPHQDVYGKQAIRIEFAKADCLVCAQRIHCTKAKSGPRTLKVRPQREHIALQQARERQATEAFKQQYKARAGVEGTFSQACRTFNLRRTRFRGLAKTHLHHTLIAAAINLTRIVSWLSGTPKSKTRTSNLLALSAI